jgi:hypothetical protein
MTNRLDTLGPHARASESPSHARLHVSRTGAWIYRTTTALMHTLHSFPRVPGRARRVVVEKGRGGARAFTPRQRLLEMKVIHFGRSHYPSRRITEASEGSAGACANHRASTMKGVQKCSVNNKFATCVFVC